jgi:(p)ppGpp synthase/HD superfamily hydrolase
MTTNIDIVEKARIFATAAHAATGQIRKYTGEPYIVHPAEVADLVRYVGGTDSMLAAAWMHDVLEDTQVNADLMRSEFGDEITDLVLWLTDVSKPTDGNRATRKALDRLHTAAAPAEAQTIKLADLISNTKSIRAHDPNFAKVYIEEKKLLLEVLTKGDPILRVNAFNSIKE